MTTAVSIVTSNVAKVLGVYPKKGALALNSDADILILREEDFMIEKVLAKGELMVDNGTAIKRGRFEHFFPDMNTSALTGK
jgi:beta-aspartyl-dipeptidase (metallo-type)